MPKRVEHYYSTTAAAEDEEFYDGEEGGGEDEYDDEYRSYVSTDSDAVDEEEDEFESWERSLKLIGKRREVMKEEVESWNIRIRGPDEPIEWTVLPNPYRKRRIKTSFNVKWGSLLPGYIPSPPSTPYSSDSEEEEETVMEIPNDKEILQEEPPQPVKAPDNFWKVEEKVSPILLSEIQEEENKRLYAPPLPPSRPLHPSSRPPRSRLLSNQQDNSSCNSHNHQGRSLLLNRRPSSPPNQKPSLPTSPAPPHNSRSSSRPPNKSSSSSSPALESKNASSNTTTNSSASTLKKSPPSDQRKSNSSKRWDLLCSLAVGHDTHCKFSHQLSQWTPKDCRFKEKCNKSKNNCCHFWHPEKENKKEYIQRMFQFKDSYFSKHKKEFSKLYL